MDSYIDRHFVDEGGYTGNSYYVRIIRRHDSKIWDNDSESLKDVGDVTWDNSAKPLVEEGTTGTYPVLIPEDFPAGTYDVIVYLEAGSSPDNTDNVADNWQTRVGDIFGF
jgi:hypothetical protein